MAQGDVTIDLKGNDRHLQGTLDKSEGTIKSFGKSVSKVFIALAALTAVKKIFDFGNKLITLYNEQQQAETKLASVLKATGEAAGFSLDQMKKLASQMQEVTTTGDETALSAMAVMATFKNIRGDVFKDAMMSAADMAEVLGGDLTSNVMMLSKALNDPLTGMTKLARSGVTFTEEQKKMVEQLTRTGDVMGAQRVILDELNGQLGGAAVEAAKTFGGQMTQLKNRFGDIGESLGGALIPLLEKLVPIFEWVASAIESSVPAIESFVSWINNIYDALVNFLMPAVEFATNNWIKQWTAVQMFMEGIFDIFKGIFGGMGDSLGGFISTVGEYLGQFQDFITNLLVDSLLWAQVIIENWSVHVQTLLARVALFIVKAWENVRHFFGEVLPKTMEWFGNNWRNVLTDMFNFSTQVFQNILKNAGSFIKAIKDFLSGKGWTFEAVGLTDGFESALDEFPDIAKRKKSDIEKALESQVQAGADTLNNAFTEKKAEWEKRWKDNQSTVNSMFSKQGADMSEIEANEAALSAKFGVTKPKDATATAAAGKEKADEEFAASFEGLQSLNQRIQASAASSKKEDQVKVQGEKQSALLTGIKTGIDAIAGFTNSTAEKVGEVVQEIPMVGALK